MRATISAVTSTGDFLPGMAAVVMTASCLGHDLHHQFPLLAVELLAHLLGVSPFGFRGGGLQLHFDELGRQGFAPAP